MEWGVGIFQKSGIRASERATRRPVEHTAAVSAHERTGSAIELEDEVGVVCRHVYVARAVKGEVLRAEQPRHRRRDAMLLRAERAEVRAGMRLVPEGAGWDVMV